MSGTIAHAQREKEKRQKEVEQLITLNSNRTALLNLVVGYMQSKYGDDSFYNDHPLVSAILQSARGGIIDLTKLANDVTNYQPVETE